MQTEINKRQYDNKFCVYALVKDPTIDNIGVKDENSKELVFHRWVCMSVNNTYNEAKENEKLYKNQ